MLLELELSKKILLQTLWTESVLVKAYLICGNEALWYIFKDYEMVSAVHFWTRFNWYWYTWKRYFLFGFRIHSRVYRNNELSREAMAWSLSHLLLKQEGRGSIPARGKPSLRPISPIPCLQVAKMCQGSPSPQKGPWEDGASKMSSTREDKKIALVALQLDSDSGPVHLKVFF